MRSPQGSKIVKILAPVSVSNTTATVTEVDSKGFSSMRVVVGIGVTTAALTALALQAGDTSGSGWTTVTGLDFSASGSLPSGTDDGLHWIFDVNLNGRGRYWNLLMTTDAQSGLYCAYAILTEANQSPDTNAERGNATGGYLAV